MSRLNSILCSILILCVFYPHNLNAQPPNDLCENAIYIDDGSSAQSVITTSATDDDPSTCIVEANPVGLRKSAWFKWNADCTGKVRYGSCGSNFDSTIGVWEKTTDTCVSSGDVQYSCIDDGGCTNDQYDAAEIIDVVGGRTYVFAIGGYDANDHGTAMFTLFACVPEDCYPVCGTDEVCNDSTYVCDCQVGYERTAQNAPCLPICDTVVCGENSKCSAPNTCQCEEGFASASGDSTDCTIKETITESPFNGPAGPIAIASGVIVGLGLFIGAGMFFTRDSTAADDALLAAGKKPSDIAVGEKKNQNQKSKPKETGEALKTSAAIGDKHANDVEGARKGSKAPIGASTKDKINDGSDIPKTLALIAASLNVSQNQFLEMCLNSSTIGATALIKSTITIDADDWAKKWIYIYEFHKKSYDLAIAVSSWHIKEKELKSPSDTFVRSSQSVSYCRTYVKHFGTNWMKSILRTPFSSFIHSSADKLEKAEVVPDTPEYIALIKTGAKGFLTGIFASLDKKKAPDQIRALANSIRSTQSKRWPGTGQTSLARLIFGHVFHSIFTTPGTYDITSSASSLAPEVLDALQAISKLIQIASLPPDAVVAGSDSLQIHGADLRIEFGSRIEKWLSSISDKNPYKGANGTARKTSVHAKSVGESISADKSSEAVQEVYSICYDNSVAVLDQLSKFKDPKYKTEWITIFGRPNGWAEPTPDFGNNTKTPKTLRAGSSPSKTRRRKSSGGGGGRGRSNNRSRSRSGSRHRGTSGSTPGTGSGRRRSSQGRKKAPKTNPIIRATTTDGEELIDDTKSFISGSAVRDGGWDN